MWLERTSIVRARAEGVNNRKMIGSGERGIFPRRLCMCVRGYGGILDQQESARSKAAQEQGFIPLRPGRL